MSGIKINMNGQPMGLMLYLVKICSDVIEEILGKFDVKQHNFKTLDLLKDYLASCLWNP